MDDLFDLGVSVITTGNHAWDKKEISMYFPLEPRLLRPANYPSGVPGTRQLCVYDGGWRVARDSSAHGTGLYADA